MLLGFDIGGTKSAVIIGETAGDGSLQIKRKEAIPTSGTPQQMIASLFSLAGKIMNELNAGIASISGIGISCGGPLDSKKGVVLSPPNLPGWDNIPIVEICEKTFGVKTILQNDANACAVAEWKYGAGKGCSNVIFLTFGTGMGAGLIIDGKLYSGTTDLAGEVGHLRLADTGPVGFGKAGSFEGYCSGGGIAQLAQIKAREQLQMGNRVSFCKSMQDLPSISAKIVAEAADDGDPVAIDVYGTCGFYLGRGLSLLIDILNPEIIIMGSIYLRGRHLIEPYMRESIAREALHQSYANCRIEPAGLGEQIGDYAALSLASMATKDFI
jgi:glucokinase